MLHVCVLWECEGDGNAGVGSGGGVVAVSVCVWAVHVAQVFCLVHVTCLR